MGICYFINVEKGCKMYLLIEKLDNVIFDKLL